MAEDGDTRLVDEILLVISHTSQGSSWVRRHISPFICQMLSTWDSDVRVRTAVHALSYVEDAWFHNADKSTFVNLWMMAASYLEYTPETGQSVVEVLLRMACVYHWRPHITKEAWRWLKRRPELPPVCRARSLCCNDLGAISKVESLKDIEILKGYLIVVWSEWDWLAPWVCSYMCAVIRKRFRGERKKGHREELRDRLLHIQKQLDLGLDHLRSQGSEMPGDYLQPTKEAYEALLETISEVELLQISRESSPDRDSTPDRENTLSYYESTPSYYESTPRYRRRASRSPRLILPSNSNAFSHDVIPRYSRRDSRSPETILLSRRSTSPSPQRIFHSRRRASRSPETILRSRRSASRSPEIILQSRRSASLPPERILRSRRSTFRSPEGILRSRRRARRSPERIVYSLRRASRSPERIMYSLRRASRSPERVLYSRRGTSRSLESTDEDTDSRALRMVYHVYHPH